MTRKYGLTASVCALLLSVSSGTVAATFGSPLAGLDMALVYGGSLWSVGCAFAAGAALPFIISGVGAAVGVVAGTAALICAMTV